MLRKIEENTEIDKNQRDDTWFENNSSVDSEKLIITKSPLQEQLEKLAKNADVISEHTDSYSEDEVKQIKKPIANSILTKLVNESRTLTESEFDQTSIRKKIVAQKSLFKGRPNFSMLFENRNEMLNRIMGNWDDN